MDLDKMISINSLSLEEYISNIVEQKIDEYFTNTKEVEIESKYRYCDTAKLADILGVTKQTVSNRTNNGDYTPTRSGRDNIFDLNQVREVNPVEVERYFRNKLMLEMKNNNVKK
jgi:DNA-binding XRE family transcriptional regulator